MTVHPHSRMRRLRWITFTLVVMAYVLSFFHRVAPGTIAIDLQQAFNVSSTVLGSIAATYFYIYMLMQIPTGILVDTLGARHILTLGGIVAGIGSILFGIAETVTAVSIGRLLVGLGVSVTFIALLKLHATWFHDRHFGSITGLSILLGNIGALAATAPFAALLTYISWRTVFEAVGMLSLSVALLTWFLVRNSPTEAGLPSMRELDGKDAHPHHSAHWFEGLRTVLRNRATWPPFWVNVGLAGAFLAFAGLWATPFLQNTYGMTRAIATQHTSLLLAGFALGALIIGALSDHLGRRRPVIVIAALVHLLCWPPLLIGTPLSSGLGYMLFFTMGLSASSFTLSWACAKEVNLHAHSGMATSVANTGAFLGTGILQPLVGQSIDLSGSYSAGLWILFGFAMVGFVGTLRIRETYCRYVISEP